MTADTVRRLRLEWVFGFPDVSDSGSQATMVAGRVLVGTRNGLVYALDAATGCVHWVHEAPAEIRSAISVGPAEGGGFTAYFGDAFASVHAVDLLTGDLRWTTTVEDHPASRITGAPALHEGRLYVPVASLEEVSAADPRYECCTFRGSVVALDADTGDRIWKTYVIRESPQPTRINAAGAQNHGPSGAGVWSAPTLDPARNLLYLATGDTYSDPAAPESDALMTLAMDTGAIRWVTQTTPGDAFTIACVAAGTIPGLPTSDNPIARANCPESAGPDVDYGSSPVLVTMPDGSDLLLGGQKSGVMYGVRPVDGEIVWQTRVSDGGLIGGIEWGFATDGAQVYVSISDAMEKEPGDAGGVTALRVGDGELVWHAPPVQDTCGGRQGCHTAQPAVVSLIPPAWRSPAASTAICVPTRPTLDESSGTSTPPASSRPLTVSRHTAARSTVPGPPSSTACCTWSPATAVSVSCRATCCWPSRWRSSGLLENRSRFGDLGCRLQPSDADGGRPLWTDGLIPVSPVLGVGVRHLMA